MPQASDELRAKFPGDDQEAFAVIREYFTVTRSGLIYPKDDNHRMTPREGDAIDYLCDEWDYSYFKLKLWSECPRCDNGIYNGRECAICWGTGRITESLLQR